MSRHFSRASAVGLAVLLVAYTAVGLTTTLSAQADTTPVDAGEFVPIAPTNVVTSANNIGWSGKIQPGATFNVIVTGVGSGASAVPAEGVSAVLLYIQTSGSTNTSDSNGTLTAWPTGSSRPPNGTLSNAPQGSTADDTAFVQVGTGGQVSFYDGANSAAVQVVVNVEGYVTSSATTAAGATFKTVTPTRIIDTTDGIGGRSTPLAAGNPWTFHLLGASSVVPTTGVSAVALNVGVHANTNCWVQTQPAGTSLSNTTYPRTNGFPGSAAEQELAIVSPNSTGDITLSTSCASVDIFVDVEGYYLSTADGSSGDVYVPITNPIRVVNSSANVGISGPMTNGRTVSGSGAVPVAGITGVPAQADAVALSLRAINATSHGYDTIWADGTPEPTGTSSIDADADVTENNLAFVSTLPNAAIDIAGHGSDPSESNDLYVDVEGYFLAPEPPAQVAISNMCVSNSVDQCTSPDATEDTTPQFFAQTADPYNYNLQYDFEVWTDPMDGSSASMVTSGMSPRVASGASATWSDVTPLTIGTLYKFRVQATNEWLTSSWSDWYEFVVSSTVGGDSGWGPDDSGVNPLTDGTSASTPDQEESIAEQTPDTMPADDSSNYDSDSVSCESADYVANGVDTDTDPGIDADNSTDDTALTFPSSSFCANADPVGRAYDRVTSAECTANAPMNRLRGWTKNRFSWCARGSGFARSPLDSNEEYDQIDFNGTEVMASYRDTREIDVSFNFDNFTTTGDDPGYVEIMDDAVSLGLSGWPSSGQCHYQAASNQTVTKTFFQWEANPSVSWKLYSNVPGSETSGGAPDLGTCVISLNMKFVQAAKSGKHPPVTGLRCDSASYLAAPGGCVFDRIPPSIDFSGAPSSPVAGVADHVWEAVHNPAATFPKFANKSIPGGSKNSLIHRYRGSVNRSKIKQACIDEWGTNYRENGTYDCDGFPFASTKERGEIPNNNDYSVAQVAVSDNRSAGGRLGNWYQNNRILDYQNLDGFFVGTPGVG